MKKIFLILAVLMLAAPVMAEPNNITITATVVDSDYPAEVEITYAVTTGKIPRAFALDITVTAGTIVDIGNFFVGECNDSNGYGIFPANFNRYINADFNNWDDVNYTPVADVNDLPGDTEGGIGTGGITIEMGSLYDVAKGKGPPETSGTLCSIFVDSDCHVDLALNVGRAGIVMEDGNSPDNITWNETDVTVVCTVPDVEGDVNLMAQVTIQGANFGIGDITTACSDTIADGNVISTDPAAFTTPGCGTDVNIVVSTGQPTVPNVLDMNETEAIAAINLVAYISAGTPTYACSDTVADGDVISTTPGAGSASCGTTVAIVVSDGQPTVPSVVGQAEAAAIAAIGAVDYISVTVSYDCNDGIADGNVISQDLVGVQPCGTTVDILVSGHPDYAQWLLVGEPPCWCSEVNPWQCKGDADGTGQGFGGKYRVSTRDTEVFRAAYNKSTANFGGKTWADVNVFDVDPGCTGAVASVLLICADVDHLGQGFGGKYRVSTNDTPFFRSATFGGNYNVANLDPNCP